MAGRTPELSREELALMAAYEAAMGGDARGSSRAEPAPELSPELAAELDDYLALERRIAELPLEPVSPSVRSAIMNAAAAQAEINARPRPLARLLAMLLRPGPVLIGGTVAALALAIVVRQAPDAGVADGGGEETMVAMRSPEPARPSAAEAEATPEPAKAAAKKEEAKPARTAPRRTFAATPASLGPGDKAAAKPKARAPAEADIPAVPGADGDAQLADRAAARLAARNRARPRKKAGRATKPVAVAQAAAEPAAGEIDGLLKSRNTYAKENVARRAPSGGEGTLMADRERAQQKTPRWTPPPSTPGKRWPLRNEDKAKLAANAWNKGRDRAPSDGGAEMDNASDDSVRAASAPPAKRRNARFAPAPPPSAKPQPEPARDLKDSKRADSVDVAKPAIAKLRRKLSKTKSETARIAVLRDILKTARKTGDVKTERWAAKELAMLQTARARRTASSKAGAKKRASKKAVSKRAVSKKAVSKKGAPSRPKAGAASKRAPARPAEQVAPAAYK